jgi:hypothetical protein
MSRGNARYRFEWLKCSRPADGTTGDRPRSYTSNGYLWGSAVFDNATEQSELGATRSTIVGTLTFRGWVPLSTLDRLNYVQFGQTFLVDGVRNPGDGYETIVDVHLLTTEADPT